MEFVIHPNVYTTGNNTGLRSILENTWVRNHKSGNGNFYIVSGFANYNGGARFYRTFSDHIDSGGKITAFIGGSTSTRLSSIQVVEALLDCGVNVNIVNRSRLLHAKLYGVQTHESQKLVISSGNFTGPGMSQNIEASVLIDNQNLSDIHFSWDNVIEQFYSQNWLIYQPTLDNRQGPAWQLLYDESPTNIPIQESEERTLVVLLGHSDTVRIQAERGTDASKGSQYFWLSKDCFDFFPPLTIRNVRGYKGTLSTTINLHYVNLGETRTERVTFEAENNLDFRLGTGLLRNTGLADVGDLACLSRISEDTYELRILRPTNEKHDTISRHAINYIGHKGKRYGYLDNNEFKEILDIE